MVVAIQKTWTAAYMYSVGVVKALFTNSPQPLFWPELCLLWYVDQLPTSLPTDMGLLRDDD